MSTVSVKNNLRLWERAKQKACTQGGLCVHSARKMQWATRYYKAHGGGYLGGKSHTNSLSRWGRQKWRTSSGKKSAGKLRYLPDKAWRHLSRREIRQTNDSKRRGYKRGKQWVRQPTHIAKKTSRFRSKRHTTTRRTARVKKDSVHRSRHMKRQRK